MTMSPVAPSEPAADTATASATPTSSVQVPSQAPMAPGWRLRHLRDGRVFPLPERMLDTVRPGRMRRKVDRRLVDRVRRASDGEPYFDLNGTRLFFRPRRPGIDEAAVLEGAMLVVKEAFVNAVDFFDGEVDVGPGDVALDVGANIGTSALILSPRVGRGMGGGRVYSFEPVFCDLLVRNVCENRLTNVEPVPMAVGDRCGEAEFGVTDTGIDSRLRSGNPRGRSVRVAMTTLDAFVEERGLDRVDFIKLDIEGAEEMALRGAERTIERFRPKLTIASYHTDPEGDKQHPKLVRLLKGWGLRVKEVAQQRIYAWSALLCASGPALEMAAAV